MFITENNLFLLSTATTSLLLRVNEAKKLVCEYYGARLKDLQGAPALVRNFPVGQGTSLAVDEGQLSALSPDYFKSEFALAGKGDYNAPSLVMENEDGTVFDFLYSGYELLKETSLIRGLPTPHGGKEEVVFSFVESVMKATLRLHYVIYEEQDVIGRYVEIENDNEKPLTLHKAASLQLALVNEDFTLVTLYGSWANELNQERQLVRHGRFLNESFNGFSSNRHNPFFLLDSKGTTATDGRSYGFNLVYSGNHQESLELDAFSLLRIQCGVSPFLFRKILAKGASFSTPMAVMSTSKDGENGVSHHFQRFVNDCVIPLPWRGKPRPIVYNNWEATMFNFDKGKLVALMKEASDLGIELFVLDDGWFGSRNDDSHGLGDWQANLKKIPGGLASLAKEANKRGLQFGIWMEPEMVNEESDLYRAHPEWIVHDALHTPSKGRHQFTLDLSKIEVQDYVYTAVKGVLLSAPIAFLKWDCNRPLSDFPASSSSFFFDYMLGLYSVLNRLIAEFPNVLFENCASGGNRFDLGMLSYFPQSWQSDDTDSFERNRIQSGALLGYPLSTLSNHVSAKTSNQLLRSTSLDSKFDVAAFGVLGYELDLNDLSPLDREIIRAQILYYKEHRTLCQFGSFSALASFSEGNEARFEVTLGKEALLGYYEKLQCPAPKETRLIAAGLESDVLYHFCERQESISLKKFGHLLNLVAPVHLKEDGFLVNFLAAHRDMKSEQSEGEAYGSAFSSVGVALPQEWSGTGYNDQVRLLGDFGGRLYYLKAVEKA